jgi:hypothetical protein
MKFIVAAISCSTSMVAEDFLKYAMDHRVFGSLRECLFRLKLPVPL